jgi:G6PDH family F420-dependent oxidoreductase
MKIGYKLFAEAYEPKEVVRQAVEAERAGFDFVEVSDHYHPWLYSHGHSGFAWSMLGAAAARTSTIELATGVTCPIIRYHPAIIAQAAATVACLSDGRFMLGVGSGERLNEHVVGSGWPSVTTRHEMLREALEIIKLLWTGGYQSYEGQYFDVDDARVFDLPSTPPPIIVAAGGERSAALAASHGDALFATEPKSSITAAYKKAGGKGDRYCEVPLAYGKDEATAAASAHKLMRFALQGWKVQAELPNPINFEASTSAITEEDMRKVFACGPDPAHHVEVAGQFLDAGFDHIALMNAGPDIDGFFEFFATELKDRLVDSR